MSKSREETTQGDSTNNKKTNAPPNDANTELSKLLDANSQLSILNESLRDEIKILMQKGEILTTEYYILLEKIGAAKDAIFSSHKESGTFQETEKKDTYEETDLIECAEEMLSDIEPGKIPDRVKSCLFVNLSDISQDDEKEGINTNDPTSQECCKTCKTKRKKKKTKEESKPKKEKIDINNLRKFEKNWKSRNAGDFDISIQHLLDKKDGVIFDYYYDGRKIENFEDVIIPIGENGHPTTLFDAEVISSEVEIRRELYIRNHVRLTFTESYIKKKNDSDSDVSKETLAEEKRIKVKTAFVKCLQKAKEKWFARHCVNDDTTHSASNTSPHSVNHSNTYNCISGKTFADAPESSSTIAGNQERDCKNGLSGCQPQYVAPDAEGINHVSGGRFYTTSTLKKLFDHSLVSPALLAWFMIMRFVLMVPNNRVTKQLWNLGLRCPQGTYANWNHLAGKSLKKFKRFLRKELKKQRYVHADESYILVFRESERSDKTKSYFWLYVSIDESDHPVCIWEYHAGRSGSFAKEDLTGWMVKLIRDGYKGYGNIEGIIAHCLCNAHARRYFWLAAKHSITSYQRAYASKVVALYDEIFKIEREIKRKTPEERLARRASDVKPLMDQIAMLVEEILKDKRVFENGQLHKAAIYFENNEKGLREFLSDPLVPASNNKAERMVKPFSLFRRNSLFIGSPESADDIATIMSVIRTAELNGLDPEKYLTYIWEHLRGFNWETEDEQPGDEELFCKLLPWAEGPQMYCKAVINPRQKEHVFVPCGD